MLSYHPRSRFNALIIFLRKLDPLGKEIKNVDFSRLGNMLHIENQKGEEAMKT